MKSISELTYVQFISLLEETNRPPGGKHTVRYWIRNAFIQQQSRVLEIGSNTGFTSLEIARNIGCRVTGVDVSPETVDVALRTLSADCEHIQSIVDFKVGNAEHLEFEDSGFDVVVCGGALSFVSDRTVALGELMRVLTPWGRICVSPLVYEQAPPDSILNELATILGFSITPMSSKDWLDKFELAGFELYHHQVIPLEKPHAARILEYVDQLLEPMKCLWHSERFFEVRERAIKTYSCFSDNHEFLSFMPAVIRKRHLPEQEELFKLGEAEREKIG